MLIIAGKIRLDPQNRETADAAAIEMMAETRKEPGNLSYTFSSDLADPGTVYIFEEWESQQTLDAHFKMPHMARFQGIIGGLGVLEMSVQKYQVSSVGPIR